MPLSKPALGRDEPDSPIFALNIRRYSDIILAVFVVVVASMLLVPLPTPLLDVLIVLNISFSLLLLLVGLYVPNPLTLFTFPTLLLLSTLFRLSLNVASSRLILMQGDAGRVIESFGQFLVRGEIAVGVIIFTIVTIVNFIVIARGSSRVSEVAARFALDALPGRQMAIDADLRSGLISPTEAQRRREHLRRESQLYGAMDGSMKFVQGDAIAGFFIIFTNILGGIYLGMSNGMGFSEALHSYTILTIGDGLVTQIPALFISICAGIVVTRVASSDDATLSQDVGVQILARPGAILLAGAILLGIGLFPGLPTLPFALVGVLFFTWGYLLKRRPAAHSDEEPFRTPATLPLKGGPALLGLPSAGGSEGEERTSPLVVALDAAVLYRIYRANAHHYDAQWRELQSSFFEQVGIRIPDRQVIADDHLPSAHYRVSCRETVIDSGVVPLDAVMVEVNPDESEVFGLEVVTEVEHPLTGSRVSWVRTTEVLRRVAQAAELRHFDFFGFISLRVASFLRAFPEEVYTLADVLRELKEIERSHPGFVEDALDRRFINAARLTEVLQELVRQRISVRDVRHIIEAIAAYCSTYAKSELEPGDFDLHEIVSFIRASKKRQLLSALSSNRQTVRVIRVSEEVEEQLASVGSAQPGGHLPLGAERFEAMRRTLVTLIDPLRGRGLLPIVIFGSAEVADKLHSLVRSIHRSLPVLCDNEVEPFTVLETVGVWRGDNP